MAARGGTSSSAGPPGTFHIQPLDAPNVRLTLDRDRGEYNKRNAGSDVSASYERYVADAADMARIIRGERVGDFPTPTTWPCRRTVLQACHLPLDK